MRLYSLQPFSQDEGFTVVLWRKTRWSKDQVSDQVSDQVKELLCLIEGDVASWALWNNDWCYNRRYCRFQI